MVTIAVDAMGGDHAPKAEVDGAVRAAGSLSVKVILVGQQDVVRRELEQHQGYQDLPIEVIHASERITMDESAAKAVRSKRDSSMRVASRLVRDGAAQGFVSAGNTGASPSPPSRKAVSARSTTRTDPPRPVIKDAAARPLRP